MLTGSPGIPGNPLGPVGPILPLRENLTLYMHFYTYVQECVFLYDLNMLLRSQIKHFTRFLALTCSPFGPGGPGGPIGPRLP